MKIKATILFCLFTTIAIAQVSAQKPDKKVTISGIVLDVDNLPLGNAMISVDGQKTNAVTDAGGNYKVKVAPGAARIGVVTFGSGMIEEEIADRTQINFNFNTESAPKEESPGVAPDRESVNVGYGTVKKKNLTHSVGKVDAASTKQTHTSIYDMLRRVSGVEVRGREVYIQDSKNLFGHVPPLFVIDGVPVDQGAIDGLSPSSIKSIEVLKGTSAAIYGSRGYGGVILITQKGLD